MNQNQVQPAEGIGDVARNNAGNSRAGKGGVWAEERWKNIESIGFKGLLKERQDYGLFSIARTGQYKNTYPRLYYDFRCGGYYPVDLSQSHIDSHNPASHHICDNILLTFSLPYYKAEISLVGIHICGLSSKSIEEAVVEAGRNWKGLPRPDLFMDAAFAALNDNSILERIYQLYAQQPRMPSAYSVSPQMLLAHQDITLLEVKSRPRRMTYEQTYRQITFPAKRILEPKIKKTALNMPRRKTRNFWLSILAEERFLDELCTFSAEAEQRS